MTSNNGINHNKHRTKATAAAIPMAGAIVTAAAILLSGLSLIGSYQQPVLAQQQDVTGAGGSTGAGGGTSDGGTVCILMTGGDDDTTGNNTTVTTGDAPAQGANATTTTSGTGGVGGENVSLSQIRMYIEQAISAFQNRDAQGVMTQLDLAHKALGGAGFQQDSNMTTTDGATTGDSATNMTAVRSGT